MTDYVLNLTNVAEPYTSEAAARADLSILLLAMASLEEDSGPQPMLRADTDPWAVPLVNLGSGRQLTLGELASSFYGTEEHDLAAYFDSLYRTIPSDSGLDNNLIEAVLRLSPKVPAPAFEQTFAAVIACEMEAAVCSVCGFILVSLLRDDRWSFDLMAFVVETEVYTFDHVATLAHAEAVRARRLERLRSGIRPRSFWYFRDKAYPHLRFGRDVEAQLEKIDSAIFPLVLRRLAELDARAVAWKNSATLQFPDGPTPITCETERTMKRYGTSRNFPGSDGKQQIFEEHLWIDRGNRIHLIRDRIQKTVEVGYIGVHLPTMQNPT